MDEIRLSPLEPEALTDDPELEELARNAGEAPLPLDPVTGRAHASGRDRDGTQKEYHCSGRPFDLRCTTPIAYDLRQLCTSLGVTSDQSLDAMLGPSIPVLLHHQLTPFAETGESPQGVWGLGYEFEPFDIDARTVSVAPDNESITVGDIRQHLKLSLGFDGVLSVPSQPQATKQTSLGLPGVRLEASSSQEAMLNVRLKLTLQKVVGAGFGRGGAKWNLYQQDENLAVSHVLLQTIVVPTGTRSISARIRTWSKKAGWLGTSFHGQLWRYPEQQVELSLQGLKS